MQALPMIHRSGPYVGISGAALAALVLLAPAAASAQGSAPPAERPFTIEQLAPGLKDLIKPDAKAELVGDRLGQAPNSRRVRRGRREAPCPLRTAPCRTCGPGCWRGYPSKDTTGIPAYPGAIGNDR